MLLNGKPKKRIFPSAEIPMSSDSNQILRGRQKPIPLKRQGSVNSKGAREGKEERKKGYKKAFVKK